MPLAIIKTKITSPDVDPTFVLRETQIARLNDATERRVTLISAAAGYGKTTLAAQWKARLSEPAAWLSIDADDNDLERFVRYLVASLRVVARGCCPTVMDLVESPQTIPARSLADTLINDLATLDRQVFLIVDDLHLISNTAIHDLMSRVTEQQPDCLRLVFLSRVKPPWPLSLWRVRGWLSEMNDEDLRFSPVESREFVTRSLPESPEDQVIDKLHQQTEGWPAGLRLALLSMSSTADPLATAKDVSSTSDEIFKYLFDEVITGLPQELQEFLQLTAPLERICAELCDELMRDKDCVGKDVPQGPSGRNLIDELQRRRLFLVPLDNERTWFRYHHLFHDLLNLRLLDGWRSCREKAICRRAGNWFATQGLIEDAIKYLVRSGDLEKAATTLWDALPNLLAADMSRRSLNRVLSKYPAEALRQQPELMLADGFLLSVRSDLDGLQKLLDDSESRINVSEVASSRRNELEGVRHALHSWCSFWRGNPELASRHGMQAINKLPERFRFSRGYGLHFAAGGLMLSGRTEEAFLLVDQAIHADAAGGSRSTGPLLVCKAMMHLIAANFDGVALAVEQMEQLQQSVPIPDYYFGYAPWFAGMVAYERNDLAAATKAFSQATDYGVRLSSRHYHETIVSLARAAMATGDLDLAWNYANNARTFAIEVSDPTSARVSDALEARLRMAGDEPLVERPPPPRKTDAVSLWLENPSLAFAEILAHQSGASEQEAALAYIDEALVLVQERFHHRHVITLTLLKALVLEELGQQETSLDLLQRCLRWGEELGLLRTFLDRGPNLQAWLQRLSSEYPDDIYLAHVLNAFESPDSSAGQSDAAHSMLTNREMDVLELMQRRLSNKQIASRLHVSAETVKTHTKSIYRKLGVNGRRDAVARAEQTGLLNRVVPLAMTPGDDVNGS